MKSWLRIDVRIGLLVGSACLVAIGACGGSESASVPTPSDSGAGEASTDPIEGGTSNDGSANADGAAIEDAGVDGEVISDGGSNIDLDGGEPEDDAGADAAVCNALANDAPVVQSTCISFVPVFSGGALVAGKYYLTGVHALGTPGFCNNQFISVGFKQTLELAVNANVGTLQSIGQIANLQTRRRTSTLTPSAGNTSPLAIEQTCPSQAGPVNRPYASGIRQNKQTIALRERYGNGEAIFVYEKQ